MEPYMSIRKCIQYSAEFKEQLLAKVFSPDSPSTVELAKRAGVPYATLYTWIKMSKHKNSIPSSTRSLRPASQSAEAKLRAVIETLDKTEEERSAYCRAHGFYPHHLEAWKAQILNGLDTTDTKKEKAEQQHLTKENKHLKSELNRKDKALAVVSALLILKKKADLLWGEKEDD
jgi:transposase-like protein